MPDIPGYRHPRERRAPEAAVVLLHDGPACAVFGGYCYAHNVWLEPIDAFVERVIADMEGAWKA